MHFLLKSKDLTDKETLVWVDFGILKITNDLEHFKNNFSKLKKYNQIFNFVLLEKDHSEMN